MKRVRLSMKAYNELLDSRNWCERKGYTSMKQWYDEELAMLEKRRALPVGMQSEVEEVEERPRGRW